MSMKTRLLKPKWSKVVTFLGLYLVLLWPTELFSQAKVITVNPQVEKVEKLSLRRKGFFVSFGPSICVGEGSMSGGHAAGTALMVCFGVDVKVGYGLTDQSLLYLGVSNSWLPLPKPASNGTGVQYNPGEFFWFKHRISGIGYQYFFDSRAPSVYLNAFIGSSIHFTDKRKGSIGLGMATSLGYELTKALSMNFGFSWTSSDYPPAEIEFGTYTQTIGYTTSMPTVIFLSLNYMFF